MWIPFGNDCHTDLQDAVEADGGTYPGSPNGRFDFDEWASNALNSLANVIGDFINWVARLFE